MPDKRSASVRSLERAISILKTFSSEEPEMGVGQLSRRLNLPKSTVHRLLLTLESGGLISKNQRTGVYRLGMELVTLGSNVLADIDLRRIAAPFLRDLSEDLNETVNLTVLDRFDAVNLDQFVPSGHMVMRVGWVGRRMPAHTVSSGKIILAFLPAASLEDLFSSPLKKLTERTITEPDALRTELARVRKRGYAMAFEELEAGLHAISGPIFSHQDEIVASVSVSGPSYRLTRARMQQHASVLTGVCKTISAALGHKESR